MRKGSTAFCVNRNNMMGSFQDLKDTFGLKNHDLFRNLQLRHKDVDGAELKPIVETICGACHQRNSKMISKLYHSLKAASIYVKAKCEQELDVTVTEEERYQACGSLQTCSNSLRWTERDIRSFITPHVKSKEPTMGDAT